LDILEKNHWSKTKTAKELNIGRTTLWRRMKQYGIIDTEN
jgi:transcriptional regulator of acetoin/glycerol metabolism